MVRIFFTTKALAASTQVVRRHLGGCDRSGMIGIELTPSKGRHETGAEHEMFMIPAGMR